MYPAVAEVSFTGEVLWDCTIVRRGLDGSVSGFDADSDRIYLALGDTVNPGEKTMVLAIDARGPRSP